MLSEFRIHFFLCFFLIFTLSGCDLPPFYKEKTKKPAQKGEYIYRQQNERHYKISKPERQLQDSSAPWKSTFTGNHFKITKEFFRCKGSSLNPVRLECKEGQEITRYYDCGGAEKHSLPLRDGKEYICPILIDILNFIQEKTGKRVVITCGHRCPDHNLYADPSAANRQSKHMLGAEVDFYVQGLEEQTEIVLNTIQEYYQHQTRYKDLKEYLIFERYEKADTNVSTPPWYNKELFIKIFKKNEGRDFDNRHPYPYISLQVRFDITKNERVVYSWEKAYHNYMRW